MPPFCHKLPLSYCKGQSSVQGAKTVFHMFFLAALSDNSISVAFFFFFFWIWMVLRNFSIPHWFSKRYCWDFEDLHKKNCFKSLFPLALFHLAKSLSLVQIIFANKKHRYINVAKSFINFLALGTGF